MNQFNILDEGWKVTVTCDPLCPPETKKALYKLIELALEMVKSKKIKIDTNSKGGK